MLLAFFLGLIACPLLFVAARKVYKITESPSLSDSVQWEALATESLISTKDRGFIGVWEISGPDLSFVTPERADNLAGRFQRLLDTMDATMMLHVDTIRVPSSEYDSPDGSVPPVADMLDQRREDVYSSGTHYEDRTFIALTITPEQSASSSWLSSLLYTDDTTLGQSSYEEMVEAAESKMQEFQQYFPDEISQRRLSGKDLTSYLYFVMTGRDQEVTPPPKEYPSLRYLYSHDVQSGFTPKVGDTWFAAVAITGYPEEVRMGVSEALNDAPFPYRFSNRLIGTDRSEALKAVQKRMKQFQMQANDWMSLLSDDPEQTDPNDLYQDDHSQSLAFETKEVEREIQSGKSLLHHTGVVLVWDQDKERCKEKASQIKKYLRNAGGGFMVDEEKGLATEALIGSWPGHGAPNQRKYFLLSSSATRLLPLTGTYSGPRETPCEYYTTPEGGQPPPLFYARTSESVPYRYSPFGEEGDVGHQAVIGPTGSGKSIFLNFQALRQLHFRSGRTFVFDKGHSFAPLTEAVDGRHYDLSDIEAGFQPLAHVDQKSERRWAVQWIADICKEQGLKVGPRRREKILEVLQSLANSGKRTLQNFKQLIGGKDKDIADALKPFAGKGDLGNLLNANKDRFRDGRLVVIEIGSLADLEDSILTPVLTFFFHKVSTLLSADRPTHVIADEFFVLAQKSDIARKKVENALRTYRKKNAFMTIGTQAPGDLLGEETEGILNSIKSKIMLPNPDAMSPAEREAYQEIGLNEEQIRMISLAQQKKEYIAIQPKGARKFDLGLGSEGWELAFMTEFQDLSLKDTATLIRKHKEEFGPRWVYEWLLTRGMEKAAQNAPLDHSQREGNGSTRLLPSSFEEDDAAKSPRDRIREETTERIPSSVS